MSYTFHVQYTCAKKGQQSIYGLYKLAYPSSSNIVFAMTVLHATALIKSICMTFM